ncbi:RNA polymerase sigma factor [Rhodopirellula sp. JC639]|uniref:RNA polymerase sigma factor n=1 Tax=Stieleria mannarensis TaxID=2755585 RepID=UPI00160263D0|nr:sigma-70 family RNA polymerase sigma factor [Rhodopirellula sp. JC639]
MNTPETRPSILIRLRDHSDREAWQQFVQVYRGVIRRVAIRYGLQEADTSDVVQEVLIRISKGIVGFDHDSNQARFRTWLGQVIRSAIIDHHRRRPREQASGLTKVHEQLAQLTDKDDQQAFDQVMSHESRNEIFRWAARRIRGEFTESSWMAFWKTSVEQQSVDAVADQLGRSVGAVYTSRSRIMRRLREEVQRFDESLMPEDSSGESPDER